MKLFGHVAVAAAALTVSVAAPTPSQAVDTDGNCTPLSDPVSLYGGPIGFDVLRNGSKVGQHRVSFEYQSSGALIVSVDFNLTVTLLGFPVYRYTYESGSQWCANHLVSLWARQDDDGDKSEVNAVSEGKGMAIMGPRGEFRTEDRLFPTNHWHAGVLSQSQVLNTLSGEVSKVSIRPTQRELVEAEGRSILAMGYRYTGDIETSVWYDDLGRWVKMRFTAEDGSIIDYLCTSCGQSHLNAQGD